MTSSERFSRGVPTNAPIGPTRCGAGIGPEPRYQRPRREAGRTKRRIALSGAALLCLGWLGHGWQVTGPGLATRTGDVKGADYIQFYVMGTRVQERRGDLLYDMSEISAQAKRRISPRLEYHPERNPYGPQVALAFEPLARLPFLASLGVFSLLSVSAYVTASWLLWREASGLAGNGRYVALVAAGSPALLITLRFGQISTLTLVAVALAVLALVSEHRFVLGLCLGALAYKPQLLVLALPMLVFARDWRCLGGLLIASVAQLAVGWAGLGGEVMRRYIQMLTEVAAHPDLLMLHPENSHSLRGFLRLLGVTPGVATVIGAALIIPCALELGRVWRKRVPPLIQMSLLVLLTLLLTPHVLTYDLLLLAVPIISLAEWTTTHPDHRCFRLGVLVAVALFLAPFSPVLAAHAHVQFSTVAMTAAASLFFRLASAMDEEPSGHAASVPERLPLPSS